MNSLGTHNVTVTDDEVDLGPVTLDVDDDTLWVKVTQVEPDYPWPFSFGLLYFESSDGRTLGTVKAYGHDPGEIYKLGVGRPPLVRAGRLKFYSRHYNLSWARAKVPPSWRLLIEWESGQSSVGAPPFGTRATLGVLGDLAGAGVSYAINNGLATIRLSP